MKFLTVALLFFGYLLVYAAFAAGGRFAAQPWQGLTHDAYGADKQDQAPSTSAQTPSPSGGFNFVPGGQVVGPQPSGGGGAQAVWP